MTKTGKVARKTVVIFLLLIGLTIFFTFHCCGTVKNVYEIQLLSGRSYFFFDRPDLKFGESCIILANNIFVLGR